MKYLIVLYICLLFALPVEAMQLFSGKPHIVAAGTTYLVLWDGDACTGNSRTDAKGITETCADETGTLTGATIVTTGEANYYLLADASGENLTFDLSGGDWDEDEFDIKKVVKITASTGISNMLEFRVDANNSFEVLWNNGVSELWTYYTGTSTALRNYANDNSVEQPQIGYYFVFEVKLSTTNDVFAVRICSTVGADLLECSGSEPWDTTLDIGGPTVPAITGTAASVVFGESEMGSIADPIRITELEVRTYANAP